MSDLPSIPQHIQAFFDAKVSILLVVDEVLSEWTGSGCMQIPFLLGSIKLKMNWDDKELRANDAIIRDYVRNHPDWCITRGANGGAMRKAEKQAKEALLQSKQKAKDEINELLNATLAKKKLVLSATSLADLIK